MIDPKNWVVKCPKDRNTNKKWRAIVSKVFGDTIVSEIGLYYGLSNGRITFSFVVPYKTKLISIDEAYDMLFENIIVEREKLTPYQKLKMVGFKQEQAIDAAYFEKYGRQPISMVKELDKRTALVWVENQLNVQMFINGKVFTEFTIEETIINLGKLK